MDDSPAEVRAHREALARWLDELDERHGPTPDAFDRADRLIDEALGLDRGEATYARHDSADGLRSR